MASGVEASPPSPAVKMSQIALAVALAFPTGMRELPLESHPILSPGMPSECPRSVPLAAPSTPAWAASRSGPGRCMTSPILATPPWSSRRCSTPISWPRWPAMRPGPPWPGPPPWRCPTPSSWRPLRAWGLTRTCAGPRSACWPSPRSDAWRAPRPRSDSPQGVSALYHRRS